MAIFKCKMCGGTLEINNETVAVCEYCGTQQTIPTSKDENLQSLFNRANILRIKSEFDKAEQIYEKILQVKNDEAEAYWGLILCKYGIEYVEDPATFKRLPTCHRTSYDSIIADEDYKSALQYADGAQRAVYEAEAKAIDEIQKEILAISQKEEPYDVFICYKETDESGKRTQDSVIANDIYYQLTQEGFKVFYAAITLEDKLGSAYEPCIFAALNSAKVMLAIGTKPEHFSAVWVKNEWSRYLKMMKQDRTKTLIPCYKGMDAYELPEEFAHLQAQDMGKIGFINDIVRGIKKVIVKEDAPAPVAEPTVAVNASTAPLLKRAFMFLEDSEWAKADDFCEQVLNIDPECAEAYLGKLMAELRVNKRENLKDCAQPFDERNNYQKAVRFADDSLAALLKNANLEIRYRNAVNKKNAARSEADFKSASELFKQISGYKDSDALAAECLELAEFARKDAIYQHGKDKMASRSVAHQEEAISYFKQIPGHKGSDEFIAKCRETIDDIIREEEEARIAAEKQAKKNKKIAIISASVIAAITAIVLVITLVIVPMVKYNNAVELYNAGKYKEAKAIFAELGDYKDSATQAVESQNASDYEYAVALYEEGRYGAAVVVFTDLGDYKDSAEWVKKCEAALAEKELEDKYTAAVDLYEEGKYEEAITAFTELGDYKDSADIVNDYKQSKYRAAVALYEEGKYDEAITAFTELGDYKDASDKVGNIRLQKTKDRLKNLKVGTYVSFGAYEQDNNTSNGKEDVLWLVLEIKDGKALVISKDALDLKQYNTSYTDVTWETCTLRKWLNNDFINAAFSADEKAMIPTVTVSADKNPDYSTNPGNATQDQVFLLSITEANKYFNSNSARRCRPTDYAVAKGVYVDSYFGNSCWWWLRSPGINQGSAASVSFGGGVYVYGHGVDDGYYDAVRPAMWIELPE